MPIYEYRCQKCEQVFEHLARSMNGESRVACPECGSSKTERMLSVFAAHQGVSAQGCPALPPGAPRCAQCPGASGACSL